MQKYLVLKLQGPFQAWGKETFEGLRPVDHFPGRSALLGLVAACLGIERQDKEKLERLAESIEFAVRVDTVVCATTGKQLQSQKLTDYHTVKNARQDYLGLASHDTIQTWREYWQDSKYTILIWALENSEYDLESVENAVKRPVFTPFLGRKCCVLARPLFDTAVDAFDVVSAFDVLEPYKGTVYSPIESEGAIPLKKRDVPIINQPRQFASRIVYMSKNQRQPGKGGKDVFV